MKRIYLFVILICICVGVYSIWQYETSSQNEKRADLEYSSQIELYSQLNPDEENTENYLKESEVINSQIVAWLEIPDTNINFPIVQSEDNEYYLSHDLEGNYSYNGVPFLDYRCNGDFSCFNSIIYGHNIKGRNMFADLIEFKDKDFFNSHTYGLLTTSDTKYKINFVSCLVLKNDDFIYNTLFLSSDEKEKFVENITSKAVNYRTFSIEIKNVNFVVLSTCSYEFEDARTVVVGYLEKID